jgi:HEAT repeat protein/cyclophilin family peptidyl-prolyl cis-trans isomerase
MERSSLNRRDRRVAFLAGVVALALSGCAPGSGATAPETPEEVVEALVDAVEVHATILRAEDRRVFDDALEEALADPRAELRSAAATAAGRIGGARALAALQKLVADKDPVVRGAAVYALGLTGEVSSIPVLGDAAGDEDSRVRTSVARALGMLETSEAAHLLNVLLEDEDPDVIEAAALSVARLPDPRFAIDSLIVLTGSTDSGVVFASTYTLVRILGGSRRGVPDPLRPEIADEDRERIRRQLQSLYPNPNPDVRALIARALTAPVTPEEILTLDRFLKDTDVRVRTAAVLAWSYRGATIDRLETALADMSFHVKAAAIEGLGRIRSPDAVGKLLDLLKPDRRVEQRVRALETLATFDPGLATRASMSLSHDREPRVRLAATRTLRFSADPEVPHLGEHLLEDLDPRVRAAAVALAAKGPEPLSELPGKATTSDDPEMLVALVSAAKVRLEDAAVPPEIAMDALTALAGVWERSAANSSSDVRLAALEAAAAASTHDDARALLVRGLDDDDRRVRRRAARALQEIYGEDHGDRVGPVTERTLDDYRRIAEWARVSRAAYVIVQREGFAPGRFTAVLNTVDAPLTCWNFAQLAERNFFNRSLIHRVVPGFVIQTGARRAEGKGDPGYSIPSERNPTRFATGVLGMAREGEETHGSQWFAVVAPQPHLDDRFTAFGRVIQNFTGTVLLLEPEDRIVTVEIYEGDGTEPLR